MHRASGFRTSLFLSIFTFALATVASLPPLETVAHVDLNRYKGLWHEIARLPMERQKDCIRSQAEYIQGAKGEIMVKNRCSLADGSIKEVTGLTRIEDKVSFAKLKVNFVPAWLRFLGVGWGNYWIIDLDPEYQFAVVSEPKREYLWILSRTPGLSKEIYDGIIERIKQKGFDTSKLIVSGEIN